MARTSVVNCHERLAAVWRSYKPKENFLTQIEALMKEVEDAPIEVVAETLDFVRFLKFQRSHRKTNSDASDWTDQDLHAYAARSLEYAAQLYGDEEDLLPVDNAEAGSAGGNAHVSAR